MPANPAIAWHSLAFFFAFVLLVVLGWQGTRTQEALLATNRSVSQSLEIITSVQAILSCSEDRMAWTEVMISRLWLTERLVASRAS